MESASSSWAGREGGTRLIGSAVFAPLSPLTPASFKALRSTGVVTKFKESAADSIWCTHPVQSSRSPPWRSPRVSNKWVVIAGAYLGRGRDGVHLTQRENTFDHFGLKLGHRQLPSVWSSTVYPLHSLFYV